MSKFARFMKANKQVKSNELHAVTRTLCDDEGHPLEWEFRHISSRENEALRDECTVEVAVPGKPNLLRPKLLTGKYLQKLIVASVAEPDLYDAELQDSYGARTPEDLLFAMVDDPGEYNELAVWVQRFQGFNISFEEKVDEVKN